MLSMMLIAAGPITAMNKAGRMQKISGTVILTGTCWALVSARCRRLTRISRGLDPQHLRDRDAEGVGLHHGADERLEVGDVGPVRKRPQRLGTSLADLHLAQHP